MTIERPFPPVDPTRRRFLTVAAGGAAAVAIPSAGLTVDDPIYAAIETYRKAAVAHRAALDEQNRLELLGDPLADSVSEQPCHDEFNAFDELLSAAATTLPGIVAKLAYLEEIAKRDAWMFDDREGTAIALIESFAASLKNIVVQS